MWVRIVANLLSNAEKFTSVADTGVGIPPDELARIFERFHQVPGVIPRGPEGAGIGLSLVSDLVNGHHSTISADSTVGVGTTFTVQVPMSTASSEAAAGGHPQRPGAGVPGRGGCRAPAADEQPVSRAGARAAGCRAGAASRGQRGHAGVT